MKHGALAWGFVALALLLAVPAQAADTVYYYSSDTLHSEVVVTDANRNVVERTHYAPYGQVLNRDLRDGPGYGGHEEDPETSLVYMQQRYYDPEAGRFLSTDPVQADGGGGSFNRYEYAGDNPYKYTDPDGRAFGLDDLVGAVVGGVVGVGIEGIKDVFTGEPITKGGMAGAFVGGALMGDGLVNAPETMGGSVVLAGAARGAVVGLVSNTVQQGTDIASGTQKGYSVKSAVVSTAVGAVTGGIASKVGTVKVPGITAGRNSMAAVAKGVSTRIANGNASKMSAKTIAKSVISAQVGDAGKALTGGAGDAAKFKVCQHIDGC